MMCGLHNDSNTRLCKIHMVLRDPLGIERGEKKQGEGRGLYRSRGLRPHMACNLRLPGTSSHLPLTPCLAKLSTENLRNAHLVLAGGCNEDTTDGEGIG